jgi:DNA recombination protein RmuC
MYSFEINPVWLEVGGPALAAGLITGALFGWLLARRRSSELEDELEDQERRILTQEALAAERQAAFDAARFDLVESLGNLTQQSLRSNTEQFLRLAEQNMARQQERAQASMSEREQAVESMVRPIREALKASQEQIAALEKARSEAYGSISAQLESMQAGQKFLAQETQNLVNALRRPEVRGRWGEITLRRLVELAGMVEHCDFQEQVHSVGEGQVIRPDLLVNMPDNRQLVVDVKTPLDAYLSAIEASDDAQRQLALKRHAQKVREHVRTLASKAYWAQFSESPEFVILFIPGDQFLSAALNEDRDLIEYALTQQIILATPTSFVALLKAVAYGWRQLALAENAKEIRGMAEDLYNRLAAFTSHVNKVGRQLASSVENYNRAVGSLERSVLPSARRFAELGIQAKKDIDKLETLDPVPRTMIETTSDEEEPADADDQTMQ